MVYWRMHGAIPNDFIVKWKGNQNETAKAIIKSLLLNDIKDGKPLLVVFTGQSGTGKSYTCIKVQEILYNSIGENYSDYLKENIVLSPISYGQQIKKILKEKSLKKVFTIQLDEGRFVVGAENWGTFVNATIGHVNASARAIRVMITFIVTQSLRDIDKRLRDSINLQVICRKEQGSVFVNFRRFWIDDSDVESPKLRYRIPAGTILFPDGTRQRVRFKWRPKMIKRELWEPYEILMKKEKGELIEQKMNLLIEKIRKDMGETRLGLSEQVADRLFKNQNLMLQIGALKHGRWYPNEKSEILGLNKTEMAVLRKNLNGLLKKESENFVSKKSLEEIR